MEIQGFCINHSKSPRRITWVTCHLIEAWSRDTEPHIFPWQPSMLPWQQAPISWQPRPEWLPWVKPRWRTPPRLGGRRGSRLYYIVGLYPPPPGGEVPSRVREPLPEYPKFFQKFRLLVEIFKFFKKFFYYR